IENIYIDNDRNMVPVVSEEEKKNWDNLNELDKRYIHILRRRRKNSLKFLNSYGNVAAATTTSITGSPSFLLPKQQLNNNTNICRFVNNIFFNFLPQIKLCS